jgi:hypothetical protein
MIVTTTYRFHPYTLWQPFRWEYEDGTSAELDMHKESVRALRAMGAFVCFGKF